MDTTPTVFIVDEDPLARSVVRESAKMLNLHYEEFASGREFVEAFDPSRPGCVVLESMIPGLSGMEIQQHLATHAPATPVVFVTCRITVSGAVRAMRLGALHLLEKPIREIELWEVLQEAIAMNRRRQQEAADRRRLQERIARLTAKELEVMKAVSSGASNATMAEKFSVSQRTIELRRAQVMKKLEARSLPELVRFVLAAQSEDVSGAGSPPAAKTPAHDADWLTSDSLGGNGASSPLASGAESH